METERILGNKLFNKYLKKNKGKEIEKHLYEYSNENKNKYMNKLQYLFEILHPESSVYNKKIVSDINNGSLSTSDLIYGFPWDIYKEHWKDILDEQNKNDKIIMDKTPIYTTTQFTCSKCKNKECKTYSLQTRSADEPTTIFVNCIKCNNTWKTS